MDIPWGKLYHGAFHEKPTGCGMNIPWDMLYHGASHVKPTGYEIYVVPWGIPWETQGIWDPMGFVVYRGTFRGKPTECGICIPWDMFSHGAIHGKSTRRGICIPWEMFYNGAFHEKPTGYRIDGVFMGCPIGYIDGDAAFEMTMFQ